ncbi:MAG: right-handed parallel beta-helix repeat-containing protein, partial [Candidatus Krumholzibacteriia bacterium]
MARDRCTALLTTILILAAAVAARAATIAVPGERPTLGAALAAARPGDVIELAPGHYAEYSLAVTVPVTVRGLGAAPADVVLDGDGRGRLLSIEDVDGTVVLQNLTLREGLAAGPTSRLRSGGAVYVARSSLIAQNCRFENNRAAAHGGALRFVGAQGRLSQCVFVGNMSLLGGGAVDCSYESSPRIERCEFAGNSGGWGGALSCRGWSSPVVERSWFSGNVASDLFGYGGGVFADLESSPRLELCTFNTNRAAYGGALGCFQGSRVTIARCTVAGNVATGAGAGIYSIDGSPEMTASIVAFQSGSGIESVGMALPELGCSNVYGNTGSDVSGPVTGVSGAGPVISADPGFCSAEPGAPGAMTIDPAS